MTKLVIPPCSAEDTVQVVVAPALRPLVERLLAREGLSLFPIPCEAGHEDDDLPTFGIQRR